MKWISRERKVGQRNKMKHWAAPVNSDIKATVTNEYNPCSLSVHHVRNDPYMLSQRMPSNICYLIHRLRFEAQRYHR